MRPVPASGGRRNYVVWTKASPGAADNLAANQSFATAFAGSSSNRLRSDLRCVAHALACCCRLQPTVITNSSHRQRRRTEVRRCTLKRAPRLACEPLQLRANALVISILQLFACTRREARHIRDRET